MVRLDGLQATQAEVFCESAWLLDFLFSKPDVSQQQVDSLWVVMLNDIRKWKADVSEHDKQMVTSTVFHIVRAVLVQHSDSRYCESVCDLLLSTLERQTKGYATEEQEDFLHRLIGQSFALSEWINSYGDREWLSDQIEECLILGYQLPKTLDTSRARIYFKKAIELGYIEVLENGKFQWKGIKGSMAELAYFLGRVYNYQHNVNGNVGESFPEGDLNELFDLQPRTRLYTSLTQVYNAKTPQRWREQIDGIFDE